MTLKNDAIKINIKIKLADTLIRLKLMSKTNMKLDSLRFDRMQILRRLSAEEWRNYLKESSNMKDRL
jgi:hypothetical protein